MFISEGRAPLIDHRVPSKSFPIPRSRRNIVNSNHPSGDVYSSIPHKWVVLLGLVFCVLSGAMTPIFSILLSRLLFEVSIGASDVSSINRFGAIVLAAAAFDGLF
jgi:hypothetical protein